MLLYGDLQQGYTGLKSEKEQKVVDNLGLWDEERKKEGRKERKFNNAVK